MPLIRQYKKGNFAAGVLSPKILPFVTLTTKLVIFL